jgi:hypothetical protein
MPKNYYFLINFLFPTKPAGLPDENSWIWAIFEFQNLPSKSADIS